MASYDCIVAGSGVAGLTVALALSRHAHVLLLSKDALDESATRYAQGGIAAAIGADDSAEAHRLDTLAAGAGLVDEDSARTLTAGAAERIAALVALGMPFDRDGEQIALGREAAHSAARIVHAGGDATGFYLEQTLVRRTLDAALDLREHTVVTEIVVRDGRVAGLDILDTVSGQRERIDAPVVVLATGGAGQLYRYTTNPAVATGDGIALAYRAGAAVADMEFIQFHPTALRLPGAPATLITEAVRGEGAILRDSTGYAFAADYDPRGELAPRDVVARAIWAQMAKTDAPCVYLDLRGIDAERVRTRFPGLVATGRAHGFDPTRDLVPVAPAAHYTMGGVWTDKDGRTTLPGLYACGEVACTGVHGANRLASNSLLEGLVYGARVAADVMRNPIASTENQNADRRAEEWSHLAPGPVPEREGGSSAIGDGRESANAEPSGLRESPHEELPLTKPSPFRGTVSSPRRAGAVPSALTEGTGRRAAQAATGQGEVTPPCSLAELQALMWEDAGLVREAAGLARAGATLAAWEAELPAPATRADHELANLLLVGRLVVAAATLRQESRGAHYRSDFPEPSADGLHHTIFQRLTSPANAEELAHVAAD
jgi:L-aspartate oxidase